MEKISTVWLALFLHCSMLFAQSNFEKGNTFYEQKKYNQAIESYLLQIEQSPFDHVCYFNLGNAYYQKSAYARAIWAYEKCLLIQPNYKAAISNAKMAYEKTNLKGEWHNATPWIGRIVFSVGKNFWAMLALIFGLLFSLGLFFYFNVHVMQVRKLLLLTSLFCFTVLFSALCLAGLHYSRLHSSQKGVVLLNTHAKVAPDPNEKTALDLPAGIRVGIVQYNNQWVEISIPGNQQTAWVPANELATI
jgi:tetratricopeptide (TPR) repeat protein